MKRRRGACPVAANRAPAVRHCKPSVGWSPPASIPEAASEEQHTDPAADKGKQTQCARGTHHQQLILSYGPEPERSAKRGQAGRKQHTQLDKLHDYSLGQILDPVLLTQDRDLCV